MTLDEFEVQLETFNTRIIHVSRHSSQVERELEELKNQYFELYHLYISLSNRLAEVPVEAWSD